VVVHRFCIHHLGFVVAETICLYRGIECHAILLRTCNFSSESFRRLFFTSTTKDCNTNDAAFCFLCISATQMARDTLFFMLIMLFAIMAFGDMFYTIYLAERVNPDGECRVDEETSPSGFCRAERGPSYMTVYRVFIGDIDYEQFDANKVSVTLFTFLAFFGTVIFLNMLIAIVMESYENSRGRSAGIFGKTRVAFVAKSYIFEAFVFAPKGDANTTGRNTAMRRAFCGIPLLQVCQKRKLIVFGTVFFVLVFCLAAPILAIVDVHNGYWPRIEITKNDTESGRSYWGENELPDEETASAIMAKAYLWAALQFFIWCILVGLLVHSNTRARLFFQKIPIIKHVVYFPVRIMKFMLSIESINDTSWVWGKRNRGAPLFNRVTTISTGTSYVSAEIADWRSTSPPI
jgi:hypothetical protein